MEGKLIGGILTLAPQALLGERAEAPVAMTSTKRVTYAKIPAFDQTTQYVYQLPPVDGKSGITVGVAVGTCAVDKADVRMTPMEVTR
jgi:fructose-1,6-bisphosphatase